MPEQTTPAATPAPGSVETPKRDSLQVVKDLPPPLGRSPEEGLRRRRPRLPRLRRPAEARRLHHRGDRGLLHPRPPRLDSQGPPVARAQPPPRGVRPRPRLPQRRPLLHGLKPAPSPVMPKLGASSSSRKGSGKLMKLRSD